MSAPSAEKVTIEIERSVLDSVAIAKAERDNGMKVAESADLMGLNRTLIDHVIDDFAKTGRPFSANDLRYLDLDVPQALIGARFAHASTNRGVIRPLGFVTSTLKSTHAHPIRQWIGDPQNREDVA